MDKGTQRSGPANAADSWSSGAWESFLEERFGFPVRVIYGRSRSAPVQAKALRLPGLSTAGPKAGVAGAGAGPGAGTGRTARTVEGWELRLHGKFKDAPAPVREALATWLRAGRRATKAGPILDSWIHTEIASLPAPQRHVALDDAGDVHQLAPMAEQLFQTEFQADFQTKNRPRISWGRRTPSRSRRSLRLGSFEPTGRIVRIHPVLDQRAVPEWFVRFVLKHEILHGVIETYRDESGRWVHHGPEFRRREASWKEYEPALVWERGNLARLIRSAREGTELRVRVEELVDPDPGGGSGAGSDGGRDRSGGEPGVQLRLF